ncbi:MAG TPA: DUF4298 domain-containing protein [Bacillota bacterium]|nr:DUF4298 domain-containing protein [Bacillota bacterium]
MNPCEKIVKMESILDRHQALIDQLNQLLDDFELSQKEYHALRDYYSSAQFLEDVRMSNENLLPSDLKCGVLSEDAVFDLIGDNFNTAVRMLELATDIIKKH